MSSITADHQSELHTKAANEVSIGQDPNTLEWVIDLRSEPLVTYVTSQRTEAENHAQRIRSKLREVLVETADMAKGWCIEQGTQVAGPLSGDLFVGADRVNKALNATV